MSGLPRKRILYICADDGIPVWGGIGGSTHIREVVLALGELGCDVTIVAANTTTTDDPTLVDIPLVTAPSLDDSSIVRSADKATRRAAREGLRLGRNEALREMLDKMHADNPFDAVYERYSLFGYAGLEFASAAGLPFVLEVNSPLVEEAQEHRTLALASAAEAIRVRLFREASHVVAVSNVVALHIMSIAPTARVTVLPNAVNRARYETLPESTNVLSRYGYERPGFTVGYLGSFKPWHGLPNLIDAVAKLKRDGLNARLLIIGEGTRLRAELEERCKNKNLDGSAVFTGEAPYHVVPALLSACDALVAPYPELENFYFSPLKLFEYMASGKPIVASAIGQINDLLVHEKSALLVSAGEVDELTSALKNLHDDPQLGTALGIEARRVALAEHTWDLRAQEILSLLQSVTHASQPERAQ